MAGSTIRKHYSAGYQAAMLDLITKGEEQGIDGILTWIVDNTTDFALAQRARKMVELANNKALFCERCLANARSCAEENWADTQREHGTYVDPAQMSESAYRAWNNEMDQWAKYYVTEGTVSACEHTS